MTTSDQKWNLKYEKLVEYKREKGHCVVPQSYEQDKTLGDWVSKQRMFHKNNTIRPDRKRILDEIGFAWTVENATSTNDKLWHQQCKKLVEFKRKKGHCRVPRKCEQDSTLGNWVKTQRTSHIDKKLRLDRKRILDEIGFVWKDSKDEGWDQQHEKLVEFKREKGHCMVPSRYEQDKSLGQWVGKQRNLHTNNKLGLDRKRILEEIGFAWKHCTLSARSSTNDVRGRVIGSFHALTRYHVSHSPSFSNYLCRIRIRQLSPAVRVSQTKHH
jgi:hypothetical protein